MNVLDAMCTNMTIMTIIYHNLTAHVPHLLVHEMASFKNASGLKENTPARQSDSCITKSTEMSLTAIQRHDFILNVRPTALTVSGFRLK